MKNLIIQLFKQTRGTSTIEFALICGMIIIGLVAAVKGLADQNSGMWATVKSKSAEAIDGP
jgi:Flp pilus assembly pilin Flp